MAYKVFISHSVRDQNLVILLENLLSKFEISVFVAEWYLSPGKPIDKKVFEQIEIADCVVVLLTQNGIRSNWVQQEIGYSLKLNKPIIPIVEKGINSKDLGALQGKEYIEFDLFRPWEALNKLSTYVMSLKLKKEEQERNLFFLVGVLIIFLLFSFKSQ
jgi:hypothetical protein